MNFSKVFLEISRIFYNSKFNEAFTTEMFNEDLSCLDKLSESKEYMNIILNLSKGFYNSEFMNKPIKDINLINCDRLPRVPLGWVLHKHVQRGIFNLSTDPIRLFENGRGLSEKDLQQGKRDLNANVLDHFLRFPETIPVEWKEKVRGTLETPRVTFYGTDYGIPTSELNGHRYRFIQWSLQDNVWKTGFITCNYTDPFGLNESKYKVKISEIKYVDLFN